MNHPKFIHRSKFLCVLCVLCVFASLRFLASSAHAQSATLTINASTGNVNVPAGLTPNFATLKIGGISISIPSTDNFLTGHAGALTDSTKSASSFATSAQGGTADSAVQTIGVTTANGVSASSSGGTAPRLTISLGAITPSGPVIIGGGSQLLGSMLSVNGDIATSGDISASGMVLSSVLQMSGVTRPIPNALSAFAIDTSKPWNTKSISADQTFTFNSTASTNVFFSLQVNNTDTASHTVTIPSSISSARGATVTSFTIPASTTAALTWRYDGTNYILLNEPLKLSGDVTSIGSVTTLVNIPAVAGTNLTGTAASFTAGNATKLATGRTIALTGDVTYTSPSFDGSGNVTAAATLSQAIAPTWTGAHIWTVTPAASKPSITLTNTPYSAGSATTNFPLFYLNDSAATASTTLSTAGTYLGVNAHGSADLLNLLLDGASKFKVSSAGVLNMAGGTASAPAITFSTETNLGFFRPGSNYISLGRNGNIVMTWGDAGTYMMSTSRMAWTNSASDSYNGSTATNINQPSAGLLQVGTTASNALGSMAFVNLTLTGTAKLGSYVVSGLPSAATAGAGAMAYVTDASSTAALGLGLTVTGGGSNKSLVISDGTNWIQY